MTDRMTRLACLSAFAVLLAAVFTPPGSALAADKLSKEKTAKKACATGDFHKGIDILGDLFVTTNDPNHVYNQGRCYEQNRRLDDAIDRFR